MTGSYAIPGVYSRPRTRAEGFPRVRTDVCGMVGAAGPRHLGEPVAVNDWKSYVTAFRMTEVGDPVPPPPGGGLDATVRDYFANGGQRLWIVNVAEVPGGDDRQVFLNDMLGLGQSLEPHGLELLLRQDEVSIVVLPDLDAVETVDEDRFEPLPDRGRPCFGPCADLAAGARARPAHAGAARTETRIFSDDDVLWAQRYLLDRLAREQWRWFALLAPPPGRTAEGAVAWRDRLTGSGEGPEHGALYWPWILAQDSPGAPAQRRSPVGAVAGIFAQVDLERGPHVSPASRPVLGAIGPETPIGDPSNALAYEAGVNVLRDFPGRGLLLYGARTLRWRSRNDRGEPMAYVAPRRCLNAIARTAQVIGAPVVFEPSGVILRIKLHQLLTDYLLRVFASGALKGAEPQEAFFVHVEAVEVSEEGQLITRIGVALAAPAEFIEFRIGRETGVIEDAEAA